jgi:ferrous-iron efflux pump FieF
MIVSAVLTSSPIVLTDLTDAVSDLIHDVILFMLMGKLGRHLEFEYNYGSGKIEALASLCCDIFLISGVTAVCIFSVNDIIHPQTVTVMTVIVIILKTAETAVDLFFYRKQKKITYAGASAVTESELALCMKTLVLDVTVLAALILSFVFRSFEFGPYISPVLSIAFGIYLICVSTKRFGENLREILDRTADENTQKQILASLTSNYRRYERFNSVNTRISGRKLYADIDIEFEDDTEYTDIKALADELYKEISEQQPCEINIMIRGHSL